MKCPVYSCVCVTPAIRYWPGKGRSQTVLRRYGGELAETCGSHRWVVVTLVHLEGDVHGRGAARQRETTGCASLLS
jgi:hypothetical protein